MGQKPHVDSSVNFGNNAHVEGSIVAGRDVTNSSLDSKNIQNEVTELFQQFYIELEHNKELSSQDKQEVSTRFKEMEETLKSDDVDLSIIQKVKRFIVEKGGWLLVAGNAILSNPSIVAIIDAAAKKLIGS